MSMENIKCRVMQPADQQRVIEFYIENFYQYEPVFSSKPQMVPGPKDLADMAECICAGTSVMAYRETAAGEEMLGGLLSIGRDSTYVDNLFRAAALEGYSKYGHYLLMLATVHRKVAVCKRYGTDKIFFTFMCAVHPKCRGENIAKRLADESIALAKQLGYQVYTDCTSNFTARIAEKVQLEHLYTLKYSEFVDGNKKPYFLVPGVHEAVRTYALLLWPGSRL